jgi:hypothetical protein
MNSNVAFSTSSESSTPNPNDTIRRGNSLPKTSNLIVWLR